MEAAIRADPTPQRVREAPDDPKIRAQLVEAYLRTDDLPGAAREVCAARDRDGDEADYLPAGGCVDAGGQVCRSHRPSPA